MWLYPIERAGRSEGVVYQSAAEVPREELSDERRQAEKQIEQNGGRKIRKAEKSEEPEG